MGTYRVEWSCCGSVSETESYEPEQCPFCTDDAAPFRKNAERYLKLRNNEICDVRIVGIGKRQGAELDVSLDKLFNN